MKKKTNFCFHIKKIYNAYGFFKAFIYRAKRIGKSGDCVMCGYCKNKGCMKNKIAQKFKMAGVFGCECYTPIENNRVTTEQ